MVDFIDLVEFCKGHSNKLSGVKVYGRITGTMPEPRSLKQDTLIDDDCVCCNMDLVAVNLKGYVNELSVLGIHSPDDIYFVNGSLSVFVDKNTVLNDWYSCEGTLRLATRSKNAPVMAMFNFYKTDRAWGIHKTGVSDLEVEDFKSPDSRILAYIRNGDSVGSVQVPDDVLSLTKFYSEEPTAMDMALQQGLLGGFTESWKSTDTTSESVANIPVVGKDDFTVVSRSDLNVGSMLNDLCVLSDTAEEKRNRFINLIKSNFPYTCNNQYIKYLFNALKVNFTRSGTPYGLTGKQLIKGYLSTCGVDINMEYLGVPLWNFIVSSIKEILSSLLSGEIMNATGLGRDVINNYFSSPESLYAGILGEITGISGITLVNISKVLQENEISFSRVVNENPYLLTLFSDTLSIGEVEYLALCFGKAESTDLSIDNKTIQDYRGIAVIINYLRNCYTGDTYIFKSEFNGRLLGTVLTAKRYQSVVNQGYYLSLNISMGLGTFMSEGLTEKSWTYSKDIQWVKVKSGYIRALSESGIKSAIENALQLGLVIQFSHQSHECVAYWFKLVKELTCYRRITSISDFETSYDLQLINKYMSEFESIRGIVLTNSQRRAVQLLRHGVFAVEGLIGTGKRVVLDCIEFILNNMNIAYTSKKYSAVRKDGFEQLINASDSIELFTSMQSKSSSADCYFIVDMEFASIDSIYNLILQTDTMSRLIFMGDVSKVCTDNKGVLFKSLLNVLPCEHLSDFKSKNDIEEISRSVMTGGSLKSNNHCKFIQCKNDDIPVVTQLLCKYHIGTINEAERNLLFSKVGDSSSLLNLDTLASRDIQVISPVEKSSYSWGSYNMNNILRGVFNSSDNSMFIWGSQNKRVSFKLGDRVIHDKFGEDFQRYESYKNGVLKKSSKVGVPKGAIGVVVGFTVANRCVFEDCDTPVIDTKAVRNDTKFYGNDKYFIVVRYYDSVEKQGYYVLYRAYLDCSNTNDCIAFIDGDADYIQLHYCSTIHKTLGSKSNLVISLVGDMRFDGFLTRNLLYSHWCEAKEGLYIIGDVGDENYTQLFRARCDSSNTVLRTLGGIICR